MTYAANIEKSTLKTNFLAILKPRRVSGTFSSATAPSSPVTLNDYYTVTFDYGLVDSVSFNGSEGIYLQFPRVAFDGTYGEASTSQLTDGWWFFDESTNTLSIDVQQDPTNDIVVITYKLFLSTTEMYWYEDPTDSNTTQRFYPGLITSAPPYQSNVDDFLLGFTQSTSGQLVLDNTSKDLNRHLYDSSFNLADIDLYHVAGDFETGNIRLFYKGVMKNYSVSAQQIGFSILDANAIFDQTYYLDYRVSLNKLDDGIFLAGASGTDDKASLSSQTLDIWNAFGDNVKGLQMRDIYGRCNGIVPTNINPVTDSITTDDNRFFIIGRNTDFDETGDVQATGFSFSIDHTASNTTTRTYLDDLDVSNIPFQIGDHISVEVNNVDYGCVVTGFDEVNDYVDHTAIPSAAHVSGDNLSFSRFVKRVRLYKADEQVFVDLAVGEDFVDNNADSVKEESTNNEYQVFELQVDYPEAAQANLSAARYALWGIQLSTTLEGGRGWTTAFNPNEDFLVVECYSNRRTTIASFDFKDRDKQDSAQLILSLMKDNIGLGNTDDSAFDTITTLDSDNVGFVVPERDNADLPTFKTIINRLAVGNLLKWYLNNDNEWTVDQIKAVSSVDKTIGDDEILLPGVNYSVDYQDVVTDIILKYNVSEVNLTNERLDDPYSLQLAVQNNQNRILHGVNRELVVKTYHNNTVDAQSAADRLILALSDRKMLATFINKYRLFDGQVNDAIALSQDFIPGTTFVDGTLQSRNFVIQSITKNLDTIEIVLDDQKGVEDNSGSF